MSFTYKALPPGQFIRVLHVCLPLFKQQPTYDFEVLQLGDTGRTTARYQAVSYTWDQSGASTSSITISDGQSLNISQILIELLAILLGRKRKFRIWIDAVCINQSDPIEKASQVSMMNLVYSQASRVIVWLGPGTPISQAAFAFTNFKRRLDAAEWERWKTATDAENRGFTSLLDMLAHPWFRRAWVVQEVTLSSNVHLLCGDDSEGFGHFSEMIYALWRLFRGWDKYDDDNDAHQGLWSVTRLIAMRDEFLKGDKRGLRWETLLQAAFRCKMTDYRDAVFAFRGIGESTLPLPRPDYTIAIGQEPEYSLAVENLYIDTATVLLCHGNSLDLLALGGIERSRSSKLPTWVPDLRHFSFTEPFVPCDAAGWDAGGPLLAVKPTVVLSNQLVIQIEPLDHVNELCRMFDLTSVAEQQAVMQEIVALRTQQLGNVPETTMWQDLSMDLVFGLGIDDYLASSHYVDLFKEWLQWLRAANTETADVAEISNNDYYRTIEMRVGGWRAFGTQKGDFGIGPMEVEAGDLLCRVPGCRLPILLRRHDLNGAETRSGHQEYILVSWCYVSGIMARTDLQEEGNAMKVAIV